VTPFTVDWSDAAIDDLADIWNRAPDRRAVTTAEKVIEQLLARDPVANGDHLGEGLYRLHQPPLMVYYSVDSTQRTVEVTQANYRT
jgi:hypothetical protein